MRLISGASRASRLLAAFCTGCAIALPAYAQSIEELRDMPISALSSLDVSSITKSSGALGETPASVYVITHDDIVRSGNLTLPGILRLAPNLQIMRGAQNPVITARGLGGNLTAQNFSNKLLVLIDGRSVYTPLYSGVYWDMQDVLPEDVERIEVLSGPGATLWGANAMNGVINVITRNAGASQGLYGTGAIGNRTYDAGLRYGGTVGERVNYRLFVKRRENFESSDGANDGSRRTQVGFRVDWSPSADDLFMVQGDVYEGARSQGTTPDEEIHGLDLLARWNRSSSNGSALQVQLYYDRAGRKVLDGNGRFTVDTVDLDLQHSIPFGAGHQIIWGGGARLNHYDIFGVPNLEFVPTRATQFLANAFVQGSFALTPSVTAIAGLKVEHGPYHETELLPSARLSWKLDDETLLWAAVSRAVRSPTPFDRDVREYMPGITPPFVIGTPDFRSEKLTALEAGTRLVLTPRISATLSGFYNFYDDLRSVEPTPATLIPLYWGNGIKGESYGFDSWADVRLTDWWRIKPGYSLLVQKFRFKPGSFPLLGISQVGNDPKHRASVRSSMDIGPQINLDADLRFVSALPDPFSPSYVELGARIGWAFSERAEFSISGFNLLHDRHQELPLSQGKPLGRSVYAALKWTM